jgi:hypothetical protein
VNRAFKRRLALAAGIAALAAGGTVAAVAASTSSTPHRPHHRLGLPGGSDLPAAAAYLGVSEAQLESELSSGRSLAQIAAASAGKSESGLVGAIVAARRARIEAASTKLPQRVRVEVKRVRGQRLVSAVRGYLGLTQAQIRGDLRAGRTLAQIADSTPGRSASGLIAAIVASRRERLTAAVAAHKLTQSEASARAAGLTRRVSALVNRKRPLNAAPAAHHGH